MGQETTITMMAVPSGTVTTILCIFLSLESILCFNIDTRIPVVKQGPPNSYFGFSVAEHQVTPLSGVQENLLLVGAPLADVQSTNKTPGALYRCVATNPSSSECIPQPQIEDNNPNRGLGSRRNQWLGVTVKSMGKDKKVLVCAHRYTVNSDGRGNCMVTNANLQQAEEIFPCTDADSKAHKGDGYCQAGTSGLILPDENVVIGAPGAVHWTGTLYKLYVGSKLGVDKTLYYTPMKKENTPVPPVDYASYLGFSVAAGRFDDSGLKYVGGAPRSNWTGQVVFFYKDAAITNRDSLDYRPNQIISGEEAFSAFGYEMLAVDVNNDNYDDLIVGSPMYSDRKNPNRKAGGAIYIYMGGPGMESITSSSTPQKIMSREMNEDECLALGCMDARFGHTIAKAGDLNLDGYQDIVVGAPYEGIDKGAIYIFLGSKDGVVVPFIQRIYASDVDTGLRTFGHALAGGFDMDNNGYPDIAVGAYASDQVVMLRTRPIVDLTSRVSVSPNKFNLSETQRCKYDTTPHYCVELSICLSYTAKPAESFRERLEIQFKVQAEKDRITKRVEFKNKSPMYPNGDVIDDKMYLFTMGKEECRKEIIYLIDTFQDKLHPISFDISYNLVNKTWPTRSRRQSDTLPNINEYPILLTDQEGKTTVTVEVNFTKECGPDEICESRLDLQTEIKLNKDPNDIAIVNLGRDKIMEIEVIITNRGEPAYLSYLYLTVPPEFGWRGQKGKEPSNFSPGCAVYDTTTIKCEDIGNPFGNEAKTSNVRRFSLLLETDDLPNSPNVFEIQAEVNTTSKDLSPISMTQKTMRYRVVTKANVRVTGTAQPDSDIVYRGTPVGEFAIKTEDQIGPSINHTFKVLNEGPASVNSSKLTIYWPYELDSPYEHGKHLLYLMQYELVSGPPGSGCQHQPDILNVISVKENPEYVIRQSNNLGPEYNVAGKRRRRDTEVKPLKSDNESEPEPELETKTTKAPKTVRTGELKRKSILLDCRKGTAKCHKIVCDIGKLGDQENAVIIVRARLWKTTLLEDFPNAGEVAIRSWGSVAIDPALNIEQSSITDDEDKATTYAIPEPKELPPSEIAWWIILVAVIGGILILVILILICWKIGFFKRIKHPGYEPTYQAEKKKPKDYDNDFYT